MIRGLRVTGLALAKPLLLLVAVLFLYSGFEKLQDFTAFTEKVRSHGVLPGGIVLFSSLAVILAECIVGIGCALSSLGVVRPVVWSWAASTLFFTFALYAAFAFAAEVTPAGNSCGCGTRLMPGLGWKPIILQDTLLGGVLFTLAWWLRTAGVSRTEVMLPASESY